MLITYAIDLTFKCAICKRMAPPCGFAFTATRYVHGIGKVGYAICNDPDCMHERINHWSEYQLVQPVSKEAQ